MAKLGLELKHWFENETLKGQFETAYAAIVDEVAKKFPEVSEYKEHKKLLKALQEIGFRFSVYCATTVVALNNLKIEEQLQELGIDTSKLQ